MLCWSSQGLWSGQVLGFLLERLGTGNQRGPGTSPQDSAEVGPRTGARKGDAGLGQPIHPGVAWESAEMGLGRDEGVEARPGSQEVPSTQPWEVGSPSVSMFSYCLTY